MTPRAPLRFFSLAIMITAVLSMGACNKAGGGAGPGATGLSEEGYTVGDAKAPVTVIEFGSLTCPHCAHWEDATWPAFKAKYVDTGKVRYTFKETLIHGPLDAAGALLTHCVDPSKYLPTVQAIFRQQQQIFANDMRGALLNVAHSQGMSDDKFNACMADTKALEAANARQEAIIKNYNVESTPTFIINGVVHNEGAIEMDKMSAIIDPLLAKK